MLRKADKEHVCDNQKDAVLALGCIILVYIYLGGEMNFHFVEVTMIFGFTCL